MATTANNAQKTKATTTGGHMTTATDSDDDSRNADHGSTNDNEVDNDVAKKTTAMTTASTAQPTESRGQCARGRQKNLTAVAVAAIHSAAAAK